MNIVLRVMVLTLALVSSLAGLQGSFSGPGPIPWPPDPGMVTI
jgi:hypothetical protein